MTKKNIILLALCGLLSTQSIFADLSPADSLAFRQALSQRNFGINTFKEGNSVAAQDSLIAAYDTFMRLQRYDYASLCLYERAIEYMNIGDLDNMAVLLHQLETLAAATEEGDMTETARNLTLFNYYSVASAYYSQLDSADLAIAYGARSIQAMEQLPDPDQWFIVPVWNYYNQALYYDLYFDPSEVDSIEHYLHLAEQSIETSYDPDIQTEARISIWDMRAWLLYYRGQYDEAEQTMQQVLCMIDSVAAIHPNVIVSERGEAYKFMVMVCTEQGRYQEALEWQERLIENNAVRYNIEKTASLQEIETRYEVEKHQMQMEQLQARNLAFRRLIYTLASLLVSVVLVLIVVYLRKKNTESLLYEAALEADNAHNAMLELSAKTDISAVQLLADHLVLQVQQLPDACPYKQRTMQQLQTLDLQRLNRLFLQAARLTAMDKRYILCFAAGMTVEQVADLFHIEPASVYTVRYRLRKKFPTDGAFPY